MGQRTKKNSEGASRIFFQQIKIATTKRFVARQKEYKAFVNEKASSLTHSKSARFTLS